MAQFDVYRRRDGYLLDCQADILDQFDSRFVVPLIPIEDRPRQFPRLMPVFEIDGERLMMATHLASAVAKRELGQKRGSLAQHRYDIIGALDVLTTGY